MSFGSRSAIAVTLALAACATTVGDEPKHVTDLALAPFGEHEECAKLAPGDRVEYAFTANADVSFNIHYHDGTAIVEPITREHVQEYAGVFAPPLVQDYCLMWEAGAAGATLEYRMRIRRAAP